jgi:hypothetical protein
MTSQRLIDLLRADAVLSECLSRLSSLDLPGWYLGAGCLAQTVWNAAHDYPTGTGINDYDIVYFDSDLSLETENSVAARVASLLGDLQLCLDVKNQARVHLWYPSRFGYGIRPYTSSEDAIATWPTTATAIGVRSTGDSLAIHAPFGVEDLLGLVVRPNRVQITPSIYAAKIDRWAKQWPLLTIMHWDLGVGESGLRSAV